MKSIIFHIGFPKTGTTTLQSCLQNNEFYIGKNTNINNQTKNHSLYIRPFFGVEECFSNLSPEQFLKLLKESSVSNNIVYSDENLCLSAPVLYGGAHFITWPYINQKVNSSTLPFIINLSKLYNVSDLNIKIIVTIRRQWSLLPSLYYERSDRNVFASQTNFDNHINNIIDKPNYFNYYELYNKLNAIVSSDDILFLPIESINTKRYWNNLSSFIGYNINNDNGVAQLNKAQHISSNKNAYPIKPMRNDFRKKIIRSIIKEHTKTKKIFQDKEYRNLFSLLINQSLSVSRRETQFCLKESDYERIHKCYHNSNLLLEKNIDYDLFDLGY